MRALETGPEPVQNFLADFVRETKGELFDTREECIFFYSRDENFRKLEQGEIGDNLMYKYRARASFYLWPEICAAGMDATKQLLVERRIDGEIVDFDQFWQDFHCFVELKHAHGANREQIFAPVEASLRYDFERWIASDDVGTLVAA